jgi:AraC-like DNA-binding protein/uncharacterized cupin superfamily protein
MDKSLTLRATLHHLGRVAPQADWHMDRHVHRDFHELIVVVGGALAVRMRGQTRRALRGDVLTYPVDVWHAERAVGEEPLETLFLAWTWRDAGTHPSLPLHATDRSGRVQRLIYWMHELAPPTRPDAAHMLHVLLDALLFEVEQLSRTREQAMVAQVKAYVQNHIADPLCLDDLAGEVGLSKYHFSRTFKAAAGTTPMRFVRQVRVEAARSLLLSTSWTLRAIARQVGFSDEFQLSRVFRRVTGTPPSEVRA